LNEDSQQTNAQASALTLTVFKNLTSQQKEQEQPEEVNTQTASLKTVNASTIVKISNIFERDG